MHEFPPKYCRFFRNGFLDNKIVVNSVYDKLPFPSISYESNIMSESCTGKCIAINAARNSSLDKVPFPFVSYFLNMSANFLCFTLSLDEKFDNDSALSRKFCSKTTNICEFGLFGWFKLDCINWCLPGEPGAAVAPPLLFSFKSTLEFEGVNPLRAVLDVSIENFIASSKIKKATQEQCSCKL